MGGGGLAKDILGAPFDTFVLRLACLSALNRFALFKLLLLDLGEMDFAVIFIEKSNQFIL